MGALQAVGLAVLVVCSLGWAGAVARRLPSDLSDYRTGDDADRIAIGVHWVIAVLALLVGIGLGWPFVHQLVAAL